MKVKSIRNTKIKTKLILLGMISILGIILVGIQSILIAKEINQASTDISEQWLPSVIVVEELKTKVADYRIKEYQHVIIKSGTQKRALESKMNTLRIEIKEMFAAYEEYVFSEEEYRMFTEASSAWGAYLESSEELLNISSQTNIQDAMEEVIGGSIERFDITRDKLQSVAVYNREKAQEASIHADELYQQLVEGKVVIIIFTSILIAALIIYMIKAIDKPVEAIVEGTRRVANGDLDVYLDYHSEDEIGLLTDSINQLTSRLKSIIDDEKHMFQEIGNENFEVKSCCQQAYRGDFAPILYSIEGLKSRLEYIKKGHEGLEKGQEEEGGTIYGSRSMDVTDQKG